MDLNMFVAVFSYIGSNYGKMILGVQLILSFLVGLFMLIPGDQPEAFLQSLVDWVGKYSKK